MPESATTSFSEPAHRASDRVAEQILLRISQGELVPGQRLPGERQLAEQLGVSRVTVRAALQRLKTQGFLNAVQGGGTRVVSSTETMDPALTTMVRCGIENLRDLAEIRIALETWAGRRAALRASREQIQVMTEALERMVKAGGHSAAAEADMDFHLALAHAAGSPVFLHIMSTIREIMDPIQGLHHSQTFAQGHEDVLVNHHRAILDAVIHRDADAAAAAVGEHLDWVLERYRVYRRSKSEDCHAA